MCRNNHCPIQYQHASCMTTSIALSSPMSKEDRSSVVFLSQVEHDCPELQCALKEYLVHFCLPTCPNSERCCELTVQESGDCGSVMWRTSAFLIVTLLNIDDLPQAPLVTLELTISAGTVSWVKTHLGFTVTCSQVCNTLSAVLCSVYRHICLCFDFFCCF